jgi:uncharacterized protein (DUF1800 family)
MNLPESIRIAKEAAAYPLLQDKLNPYANESLPAGFEPESYSAAPYQGAWEEAQIIHLIRRTCFGFTLPQFATSKQMNLDALVNQLLDTQLAEPSPPLNYYVRNAAEDPNIPEGQTWVNDTTTPATVAFQRMQSMKSWAVGLQLNEGISIREKMTLFWTHHFATEMDAVQDARFAYKLNSYLRRNFLGNFKQMVKDVTKDPAMLVYLNGVKNTKAAPDENYARELFELFTLGKGNYTEDDVLQAAKILTGWRFNPANLETFFMPILHDISNKTFSSFFNNRTIQGKSGDAGAVETDELVDLIFENQQVVANFLSRKLYRFFCYYVITPEAEQSLISQMASTLIASNWEIKPVMQLLLRSEHFYATHSKACHIKNPFDFIVGFTKLFGVQVSGGEKQLYSAWNVYNNFTASQGMNYGDPPSVSGWPAYYQSPQFHQLWINSDTLTKRKQVVEALLLPTGLNIAGVNIKLRLLTFVEAIPQSEDPNILVERACFYTCAYPISEGKKAELKSILLGGQIGDFYWSSAWNLYLSDKSNQSNELIVYIRLFSFFQFLLSLPEYQLS